MLLLHYLNVMKNKPSGLSFLLLLFILSCNQEVYYTEADFAKVQKFDTHIHIYSKSSAVSDQAAADNFRMVNVSVDQGEPTLQQQEEFSHYQMQAHPGQIVYITAFDLEHWHSAQWADETITRLENSFRLGALGIKIWKNIGMVEKDSASNLIMIDNPRFDPVIQYVVSQNKTVMGHLGEPLNCWLPVEEMTVNNDRNYFARHPEYHMYKHPEFPSHADQIRARDCLLARHPNMRFVGAHLGSLEYNIDSLAARFDRFPNMAVDMAARICHLQYQSQTDRERVRNFIIRYQDRLIYASDQGMVDGDNAESVKANLHASWVNDWKYLATDKMMSAEEVNGNFQGLQLPKTVINKIYYQNAINWFGVPD